MVYMDELDQSNINTEDGDAVWLASKYGEPTRTGRPLTSISIEANAKVLEIEQSAFDLSDFEVSLVDSTTQTVRAHPKHGH